MAALQGTGRSCHIVLDVTPPMKTPAHLQLSPEETGERITAHTCEVVLRIFDPPEDCGLWLPPFNAAELEKWWMEQERIPFYWNPSNELIEMERRVFGVEPEGVTFEPPGLFLYDGSEIWFHDMWKTLRATGNHYECVLCCDTDSYLQRPDGTRVYHKGSRLLG